MKCVCVWCRKNRFRRVFECHTIDTRQDSNFHVLFSRIKIGKDSPKCIGLVLYNELPNDMKNICSSSLFKRKLRHYLGDKCLYSLREFLLSIFFSMN